MSTSPDKSPLGAGLRLASPASHSRLDHSFFENEVRPMLGSILLKKGWVTPERLDVALEEVSRTGMRLGEILLSRSWLFEPELAAALAEQFNLPYVDLATKSVDRGVAELLPLEVARRMFVVPVRFLADDSIQVAVADPSDADAQKLEQILRRPVSLAVGERSAIQACWSYLRH